MNSFLFSALALCLAAQGALAQYQSAPAYGSGYQQQRKLAPTPQTYGQPQQQAAYGGQEQQYAEPQVSQYRAPSSAASSQYDERAAPSSYGKPSYGKQQSTYGAPQQAAAYAKPAPKYEEPYYPPMPFAWGYDINDGYGGAQYHKENGDEYGKRTGSYGYTDAYGIYRQVDYVADEHGFRATIKTNEPGTANESPADVELHAYEPPSNYYAGNTNSYAAPAPAPKAAYSAPAAAPQAYSAPAQQPYGGASSYSRPATSGYSAPAQRSSGYSSRAQQQQAGYGRQQQSSYPEQYSSSVIVPVYQKAAAASKTAAAPVAPAKRY